VQSLDRRRSTREVERRDGTALSGRRVPRLRDVPRAARGSRKVGSRGLRTNGSVATGEPAGRVAFIAATAARRYVLVTLNSRLPGPTLIGLLGHELQHAVEIAGAAEVVNDSMMARLYERIGTAGARREGKRCFDSGAAVVVGHRVYKELQMSGLAHDF
jgi:hypothetical protein